MKKNVLSEVLMYLCILALGISLTIWADKVTSIVSIILGILAILYAITKFVNYFNNKERVTADNLSLVYAVVILVVGLILIIKVNFLKELISLIIGIYILLSSILKLSESINIGKTTGAKLNGPTILSLIGILIGILCIAGKFILPDVIVTYIGIMLILYSIISIAELILVNKK